MPMRSIIPAEDVHRPEDLESGRIGRHQNLRLAQMWRTVLVRPNHANHDLAARVTRTGNIELLAVDHPIVAVEFGMT